MSGATIGSGAGTIHNRAVGGAVLNIGKIATLTNRGAINGGPGSVSFSATAVGGAGVSNSGTIMTLSNTGAITGGAGSPPRLWIHLQGDRRRRRNELRHNRDADQQRRDQGRQGRGRRPSMALIVSTAVGARSGQLRHDHDADQQRQD